MVIVSRDQPLPLVPKHYVGLDRQRLLSFLGSISQTRRSRGGSFKIGSPERSSNLIGEGEEDSSDRHELQQIRRNAEAMRTIMSVASFKVLDKSSE